jgi:hypothetical protein
MKKFVAFSLGAMLTMGFAACSSDDVLDDPVVQEEDGNLAYLNVTINDVDSEDTRADIAASEFDRGTADEKAVNDVYFYFFNSSDKFIAKGRRQNTPDWTDGDDAAQNISAYQVSIVKVPNYNESNKPTHMITVINPPSDLNVTTGTTLNQALTEIKTQYQMTSDNVNYFVMSTSSYYSDYSKRESDKYYFTTDLTNATFFKSAKDAKDATDAEKVQVYVDRVAAKVTASFDSNIKWTTMGENVFKLGKFNMDGDDTKQTVLYVKFLSWGINGAGIDSYMSKNLIPTWADESTTGIGFQWNDATRHRSYWAKSVEYQTGTHQFPTEYTAGTTYKAKYISAKEMENNGVLGEPQYCNEFTQSATALSATTDYTVHLPGACTHVLLLAKFVDKNGNALDKTIVKYNSEYWWEEDLINHFYEYADAGNLKAYKRVDTENSTDTETKYIQLKASDLEVVSDDTKLNGKVEVCLTADAAKYDWLTSDGQTLAVTEVKDDSGAVTTKGKTAAEEVNKKLDEFQGTSILIRYAGGLQYYYSLIRHLNPTLTSTSKTYAVNEGYYGVVRNHAYKVTIEGFKKKVYDENHNPIDDPDDGTVGPEGPKDDEPSIDPGHGIEDPEEPIIPNQEVDNNYYIAAQINILAWRLVDQTVKL